MHAHLASLGAGSHSGSGQPSSIIVVQVGSIQQEEGTTPFIALAEGVIPETAARILAAELVVQIFERYPSPTGTYGDIPIGRE